MKGKTAVKRGRPVTGRAKAPGTSVRFDDDRRTQLAEEKARLKGLPVSYIINRALDFYFELPPDKRIPGTL
jgi:hypothetical protein